MFFIDNGLPRENRATGRRPHITGYIKTFVCCDLRRRATCEPMRLPKTGLPTFICLLGTPVEFPSTFTFSHWILSLCYSAQFLKYVGGTVCEIYRTASIIHILMAFSIGVFA